MSSQQRSTYADLESDWEASMAGNRRGWSSWSTSSKTCLVVVVLALIVVAIVVPVVVTRDKGGPESMADAISEGSLKRHLTRLQDIADAHDGSRSPQHGYNASVEYVIDYITSNTPKDYFDISVQVFPLTTFTLDSSPVLDTVAPLQTSFVFGSDYSTLSSTGNGNVTANVTYVSLGCNETYFEGFPTGNIALIRRGSCSFAEKGHIAEGAGASGVLMFNSGNAGQTGLFSGSMGEGEFTIPILSCTYALGVALSAIPDLSVHMSAHGSYKHTWTSNVIATSPPGRLPGVIVVGSHLDSVPAGPGINDNGSGSSANLEMARWFAHFHREPQHQVQFAWWGAEELGLLGSRWWVNSLTEEACRSILFNLNYDMLASPNFVRGVYDGSNANNVSLRHASGQLQSYFERYFDSVDLPHQPSPFTERSDYAPFIEVGIPAGGLATGADELKTIEERELYGGWANAILDPCYHQSCDSLEWVNTKVMTQMTKAAAHVLDTFASSSNVTDILGPPVEWRCPVTATRVRNVLHNDARMHASPTANLRSSKDYARQWLGVE